MLLFSTSAIILTVEMEDELYGRLDFHQLWVLKIWFLAVFSKFYPVHR